MYSMFFVKYFKCLIRDKFNKFCIHLLCKMEHYNALYIKESIKLRFIVPSYLLYLASPFTCFTNNTEQWNNNHLLTECYTITCMWCGYIIYKAHNDLHEPFGRNVNDKPLIITIFIAGLSYSRKWEWYKCALNCWIIPKCCT